VREMFDRISPSYDRMNLLMSMGQDGRWRRLGVRMAGVRPGDAALDVCCGTGDFAVELRRAVGPSGRVVGLDFSPQMLAVARAKSTGVDWIEGDALDLPVEDSAFDAATIAFGMRNLPDYRRGFQEMLRAVRPGGRVVCLEIARPRGLIGRIGRVWFEWIVPRLGSLIGQGRAYTYLVESVRGYPTPEEIAAVMRTAGLVNVAWKPLTFGMVTLHVGVRPNAPLTEGAGRPREAKG